MKFSTALLALAAVPAALVAAVLPGEGSGDAPAASAALAAVPAALVAAAPPGEGSGEGSGDAPATSAYAEEMKSHVRAHIEMACGILKSVAGELPLIHCNLGPPRSRKRVSSLKWFSKTVNEIAPRMPTKPKFARSDDIVVANLFVCVAKSLSRELNRQLDRAPTLILQMQDWPAKIRTLDRVYRHLCTPPKDDPLQKHGDLLRGMILEGKRYEDVYARNIAGELTRDDQNHILRLTRNLMLLHENCEKVMANI